MGKASRTKQAPDRRARIAAQREAARRAEQRKRIYIAGGAILAVVVVAVALVLVKINRNTPHPPFASNGPTGTALTSLTKDLTALPQSALDQVGAGGVNKDVFVPGSQISTAASNIGSYMATVNGTPLTSGGKPEVLYIGAEYCPYCGAQRWPMIVALSRFGTFKGLTTIHSSSTDAYANTPSWTFYGSTYTSKYITFTPIEETRNYRVGNTSNTSAAYVTLQNPTNAEAALEEQYDPGDPAQGTGSSIPFIDLGNKYVEVGNLSPYGPQDLQGKNWTQVAAAMASPTASLGKDADSAANYLIAGICGLTNNQPSTACTPAIQALEKNFATTS